MAGDMNDYSEAKALMESRGEMDQAHSNPDGSLTVLQGPAPKKPRRERKAYTIKEFDVGSRSMYRWLEREAKANERSIEGQVRFILRNEYGKATGLVIKHVTLTEKANGDDHKG